jgi:hypothetical protein
MGREAKTFAFVTRMKQLNIFSLIVILLVLCGLLYMRRQVYLHLILFLTCLEVGYAVLEKI